MGYSHKKADAKRPGVCTILSPTMEACAKGHPKKVTALPDFHQSDFIAMANSYGLVTMALKHAASY